jgi:hypothetical protein
MLDHAPTCSSCAAQRRTEDEEDRKEEKTLTVSRRVLIMQSEVHGYRDRQVNDLDVDLVVTIANCFAPPSLKTGASFLEHEQVHAGPI